MEARDYKPNSQRLPDKPRKAEKVVSGPVKRKKKSEASKLKDVFISEDATNVKSYSWTYLYQL